MNIRFFRLLVLVLALGLVAQNEPAFGQRKTVHVKEYTKKDGTTVKAHERKAPEKRASTPSVATPKPATASTPPKASKLKRASTVQTSSGLVTRDERGRIQRSDAARHAFARSTGFPEGRPGYVIDHIIPLACGGADAPSNMQWQTVDQAKAKDRVERAGCR